MDVRLVPEEPLGSEVDDAESETFRNIDGKLEILYGGHWSDVCFNGNVHWTDKDAAVACRHMGFELGAIETERYEVTTGRQYSFSSFNCIGSKSFTAGNLLLLRLSDFIRGLFTTVMGPNFTNSLMNFPRSNDR